MFLLFDIGGTNTRVATSDDLQTLSEPVIFSTPQNFEDGINKITQEAYHFLKSSSKKITGIFGCAPGPMNRQKTMLTGAPNLPEWNGQPLLNRLKLQLGCEQGVLENDAATAGLGEAHFGAAKGKNIVMYITVSTGVGGARIVGGKIDPSASGFEPGHQIIVPWNVLNLMGMSFRNSDAERNVRNPDYQDQNNINKSNVLDPGHLHSPANSGMTYAAGYLEDLIGGHSIQKQFNKLPTEIKDQNFWEECALILAYGLHNSIVHWSPDIVVLGGSLITKPNAILLERVQYHLNRIMKIFPAPPLVKSQLGDLAGLYGAMVLGRKTINH